MSAALLQDGTEGKHDTKLESYCFMILHNCLDLTIVHEPVKEHVCLRLFFSDMQERIDTINRRVSDGRRVCRSCPVNSRLATTGNLIGGVV
jgi:hypothetical protein